MGKFKDLTGLKFGRWTVVKRAENDSRGGTRWQCRCDCGTEKVVASCNLKNGHSMSCGCLRAEHILHDLTGQRFGRLTVIERVENNKFGQTRWKCHCDCGTDKVIDAQSLISGKTQSCGCLNLENHTTHQMAYTLIYRTWGSMKARCLNPNAPNYKNYGGRGIKICDEWQNDFQAFYDYVSQLEHYGEKGYTLDRINVNGNYEPNNLRWATAKEQRRNRRDNHIVEYKGVKMCLTDAAIKSGINKCTLLARVKKGDTGDELFRPVKSKK